MNNKNNNPGDGKKQYRLAKFRTKIVPIALRSKAFLINRARPFTPVVVWIQTHPRIFVLSAFFIPSFWLKFIFIKLNSDYVLEITVVPWFLLFLMILAFSLKKLNATLYQNLIGDIIDPSQSQAMTAFGEDPGFEVVRGDVDVALKDIASDIASRLAALGLKLEFFGCSEINGTADSKFNT